jgi:hypothetical protein
VQEGGGLRVKGRSLDCFHGDKGDVVEGVSLDALYKNGAEGRVDLVSEGDGGGWKWGPISFDE